MDLSDLEYEMRRKNDELEYDIRKLRARVEELHDTINEMKYRLNTIENGDDLE